MTPVAWWLLLGLSGAAICALGIFTASKPAEPIPETQKARAEMWQRLHGAPDVDPLGNPMLRIFLSVTHAAATPIARVGVSPDVLTLTGVWMAAIAPVIAHQDPRRSALAGLVVIISALTDGIDGAVAGFTGRATARGHVLDSVADRVSEALFFAAVVLAGGSGAAAVAAMCSVMLLEYTRARATVAGHSTQTGVGPITVGERPTRVIGVAITLIAMSVAPEAADFIGTWGPVVIAAVTTIGWLQLVRWLVSW